MRHFTLLAMAFAIASLQASTVSKPYPESCTIGNRPLVHPLEFVTYSYDGGIRLGENPVAYVLCEDRAQVICSAKDFEVSNYEGKKRTQGFLTIHFDNVLLPLGKDYRLIVGDGTVVSAEDTDITGFPVETSFSVPADLGDIVESYPSFRPFGTETCVSWLSGLTVYWSYETQPVGNPEWTLYRNGEPAGTWPAEVAWDWDLGQARIDFGYEKYYFERGARYSLVLPAGSVSSRYRTDIVNREVRFDFIGDYEDPENRPLTYSWCSLFYDHSDVIDKVWFRYDVPVMVTEGAKILLYEFYDAEPGEIVAQADAYFDATLNCYNVCADFGGFRLKPNHGYCFVMPEGSVVTTDGKRKNEHQEININTPASVTGISGDGIPDNTAIYDLFGRRVEHPASGSVYIRNGKKIIWK